MRISATAIKELIAVQLNEETGEEVLAALSQQVAKDPNSRAVMDLIWQIEFFFGEFKRDWIDENLSQMMDYFDESWDEYVLGAMDQLEQVGWHDLNQNQAYQQLRSIIEHLDEQYRPMVTREEGFPRAAVALVQEWDRFDEVTALLNRLKPSKREPAPKPQTWAQRAMATDSSFAQDGETTGPVVGFKEQLMEMIRQELKETTRSLPSWAKRDNMLQDVVGMTGDTYAVAMETPGHPVEVPAIVTQDMINNMSNRQLYRAASLMAQP
jgi:hypothetical protein